VSFKLTILGSSSATPTSERFFSAQILDNGHQYFLIDCAEGTQIQMRRLKIRFQKVNHILISHLHGDHFFGLPGLLTTFHLLGRDQVLHLYAPAALQSVLEQLFTISATRLVYPLEFHAVDPLVQAVIYEDKHLTIESIPLEHRIPTSGFLFREKAGLRKISKQAIEGLDIPYTEFSKLQHGHDLELPDGIVLKNSQVTLDPQPPLSYAYCSDTAYHEPLADMVKGVDHLFHEATFLEEDVSLAREKYHSTARDAALIAKKAEVKHLWLGHFSARYKTLEMMLEEACPVFENTRLAEEGNTYLLTS